MEDSFRGRRVLVTGAAGFIGSHLVERLLALGAETTAFVRYNSRNDVGFLAEVPAGVRSGLSIEFGDVRDLDTVRGLCEGVEVVFHLAALIGIPYSYARPEEVVETNVGGSLNLLLGAREAGVARFVQTSTSEVYGTGIYLPIDEKHPKQPQSVYSGSKISSDAIALSFHHSFGLPVAVCRPFNTYGPRQSDRAVIPTIASQVLGGDAVRLGNLDATRDFTYVSDTVEGFLAVAASEAAIGREVNLGTGSDISIGALVEKIGALAGRRIEVATEEERKRPDTSEVQRLLSSNELARELTGWEPRVSLDEGLERTLDFVRERPDLYDPTRYRV